MESLFGIIRSIDHMDNDYIYYNKEIWITDSVTQELEMIEW